MVVVDLQVRPVPLERRVGDEIIQIRVVLQRRGVDLPGDVVAQAPDKAKQVVARQRRGPEDIRKQRRGRGCLQHELVGPSIDLSIEVR